VNVCGVCVVCDVCEVCGVYSMCEVCVNILFWVFCIFVDIIPFRANVPLCMLLVLIVTLNERRKLGLIALFFIQTS